MEQEYLIDTKIAATAIVYNLVLLTNNVNDFLNIPGLDVVKPIDLD